MDRTLFSIAYADDTEQQTKIDFNVKNEKDRLTVCSSLIMMMINNKQFRELFFNAGINAIASADNPYEWLNTVIQNVHAAIGTSKIEPTDKTDA